MRTRPIIGGFVAVCEITLMLLSLTHVATATNVLFVDRLGSKPPNSATANVPVDKGKRPGLLLRFNCVDQATLMNPTNVCFPINAAGSTVQVKIGGSAPVTCIASATTGSPGTCTYTVVDAFQKSNTCGPGSNQPCQDTIQIVYNGVFPTVTQVKYSATNLHGAGGESENINNNSVTFTTIGGPPPTVSLELVFDISGSMILPTISGGTVSRMQALKDASQILLAPGGIINSYAIPGDKLGVSFFTTTATPDQTTCVGTNLLGADDPTHVSNVAGQIQGQNPTASTSIGAGLQSANTCGFVNEPAPQNANKQILLFSDGAQNTLPNVVFPVVGNTVQTVNSQNTVTNYPTGIHVCPITAGPLVPPALDLQQQIADASCSGRNAHTPNTDTTFTAAYLETYFAQSLAAILPTDKLEVAVDTTGTVVRGNTTVEKFLGSANDVKMTIALSSAGATNNNLALSLSAATQPPFSIQLKAPDGTVVDLANRISFGRNIAFITIPFPMFQAGAEVSHDGEWQLSINGDALREPSLNYHLIVMEDNPTLVSDFSINAQDVGTGEPIPIRVKLTDNGAAVSNATVQAQLMGPSNSQGNVLSNTPTPPPTGPGSDPASTKGQGKLDSLYNNPANASLFADKGLPTLMLLDPGNTGVYSGSFKDTSNEGHYYFTVRVRGTSAAAGDFQRTFWIARFVRSKPNPANTVFKLLSSDRQANGTVLVKLQAIPHDALGNFLGPGYENDMRIKSTQGTVESPLDDKLDGSYEITYRLPSASSNPSFTIEIIGTQVKTETLHQLGGGTGGTPPGTGHFAVFLDAGANKVLGTLGTGVNTGLSFNGGLEVIAAPRFSVEGIFGYHHFPGKVTSAIDLYQFSANAKTYLWNGPVRPFINGGPGGYRFSGGPFSGSTRFGGNVGAGVLVEINSRVGVQGSYNFHMVNTPVEVTKFHTFQGGIRFVF